MNLSLIAGTKAWIVKLDRSCFCLILMLGTCYHLPNTALIYPTRSILIFWHQESIAFDCKLLRERQIVMTIIVSMQKFALLSWANAMNFAKRHIVHSTSGIWSSAKVPNLQNDNLCLFAIFAFQHFFLGRAAKISISTIFKIHNKATLALTVKPCASKCTTWVRRAYTRRREYVQSRCHIKFMNNHFRGSASLQCNKTFDLYLAVCYALHHTHCRHCTRGRRLCYIGWLVCVFRIALTSINWPLYVYAMRCVCVCMLSTVADSRILYGDYAFSSLLSAKKKKLKKVKSSETNLPRRRMNARRQTVLAWLHLDISFTSALHMLTVC